MVFLRNFILFLFITYLGSMGTHAYRILAISPLHLKSHNNIVESLAKVLAKHGHQVDVITHFELKNPPKNYKTVVNLAGTMKQAVNAWTLEKVAEVENIDFITLLAEVSGNNICDLMSLERMQRFIKNPPNDPPYDLVITESFAANCYIGFGYYLKVPVITVTAMLEFPWCDKSLGNPTSSAFAASYETENAEMSTFWDRLKNTFLIHYNKYRFYKYTEDFQTEIMRKYLSSDIPSIKEVENNVALTLSNTYHSLYGVKPTSPRFVQIGGIQIEQNEDKLTPELQTWMDESTHGVIFFSLGLMVIIEDLPKETLLALYASFAKVSPVRVLMKIVDGQKLPSGLPKNVLTMSWVPQIPVLRHNNTRIFMTHGGLNGVLEALYFGVPMIGFPLFSDQPLNINLLTKKNMALKMDYSNIMEKDLDGALNAVLKNPMYREAAKYESSLFRDRPMNATQSAIFWVEYVIRNGPDSLRSPAVDLYWWQVELLDVYGFLLLCFSILSSKVFSIFKSIFSMIVNILCNLNSTRNRNYQRYYNLFRGSGSDDN